MNITIKRNITEELDCYKIRIKLLHKAVKVAIGFFIAGVIAIIVCQNDFGITQNSFACYLLLEIFFFLISFLIFKRVYQDKRSYNQYLKLSPLKYEANEIFSTINIDNYYFIYESKEKYSKLSWNFFKGYKLFEGNLVLFLGNVYGTLFIVKVDELTNPEYQELHDFISKNIKLKK